MEIRHERVSTEADDPLQPQLLQPSDWNALLNATMATGLFLGRVTGGTGAVEDLTPAQARTLLDLGAIYLTEAQANALYALQGHNHVGVGNLVPEAGLDIVNAPADRYILSYSGVDAKPKWITTTIYPAASLNLVTGTHNAGDITSLATRNDANIYDWSEIAAATPGFDLRVSFANVASFNTLRVQMNAAEGTGSHKAEFALWNINTLAWDLITSVRTTNGFVEGDYGVDNFANYIDTGASNTVICRVYHPLAGAAGHFDQLEYMVLVDSIAGGGGISEHGALSGLDLAGAHPATAISNTPAGSIAATTVQAAINELNGDVDTHAANTSNPHVVTQTQIGLGNVTNDAQLKRAAGDFATFTEKVTPVGADILLLEDSAAAGAKKKVQIGNLPTGAGGGYSEIQEEGTPVTARSKLNFIGSAVTVTDNAGSARTDVTIITGSTPDLLLTKRSATVDQTVTAGYSANGRRGLRDRRHVLS